MKQTLRNATMQDLATVLKDQHARKWDVVAPAARIHAEDGDLILTGAGQEITLDGVTSIDVRLRPTSVADEGIAEKLGIPTGYVRRMRREHVGLWDANINGWLGQDPARQYLVRGFTGDPGEPGVARAFLSDSYRFLDHVDVVAAIHKGIRESGANVQVASCDLTDRGMYVKVLAPEVTTYARGLLRGYRSPFTGQTGDDNPTVFAGLVFRNSETGDGAFSVAPQITVQVCSNGLTITKDAVRRVHLGSRLDEGVIRWSEETQERTLSLVESQTADAVRTFLDVAYMERVVADLEGRAETPIEGPVDKAIRVIGKRLAFGEEVTEGILDHFIRGGQFTAGGVMQAVTSHAQTIPDADTAYRVEESALRALEVAASL